MYARKMSPVVSSCSPCLYAVLRGRETMPMPCMLSSSVMTVTGREQLFPP